MFKGVNVCVYVGEGLRRSFATPDPFVLTNKICLNQQNSLTFMCPYAISLLQIRTMPRMLSPWGCAAELFRTPLSLRRPISWLKHDGRCTASCWNLLRSSSWKTWRDRLQGHTYGLDNQECAADNLCHRSFYFMILLSPRNEHVSYAQDTLMCRIYSCEILDISNQEKEPFHWQLLA